MAYKTDTNDFHIEALPWRRTLFRMSDVVAIHGHVMHVAEETLPHLRTLNRKAEVFGSGQLL